MEWLHGSCINVVIENTHYKTLAYLFTTQATDSFSHREPSVSLLYYNDKSISIAKVSRMLERASFL